jgi:hypothetical protein
MAEQPSQAVVESSSLMVESIHVSSILLEHPILKTI